MKKLICMLLLAVAVTAQAQNPYKKYTEKLPFQMPEVAAPVIPNYEVNLKKFGAVGDGLTLNTKAFEKAIAALSKKGGAPMAATHSKMACDCATGQRRRHSAATSSTPSPHHHGTGADRW